VRSVNGGQEGWVKVGNFKKTQWYINFWLWDNLSLGV
jgi:hypothetical protein